MTFRSTIILTTALAPLLAAHAAAAQTVIYSPAHADGRVIVTGSDGRLQVLTLPRRTLTSSRFAIGDATLRLGIDYVPFDAGLPLHRIDDARAIYGGVLEEPATQITAEQARGRVVVLTTRKPSAMTISVGGDDRFAGAAAVITVNSDAGFAAVSRVGGLTSVVVTAPAAQASPVCIVMTDRAAARLFESPLEGLEPGTLGRTVDAEFVYATMS